MAPRRMPKSKRKPRSETDIWDCSPHECCSSPRVGAERGEPRGSPSRERADSDVKLAPKFWELVESLAGPHSIDLLALDSNSQCHRHYTPYPTPLSTGVNLFAHNPGFDEHDREENGYLFPPVYLIGPALQHPLSCNARATLLVPDIFPRPYRWPVLCRCANGRFLLTEQGTHEVLIWPSKQHAFH